MALQVWLPFTDGTLKQQGLSSDAATQTGTINLTNEGKLGKCVTFGTAGGGVTLPASTMTSFTECSVAFWIKIISWNTSYATFFQAGLGSTPWAHYIFGILRNGTNSNLCFSLTNSNGSSSSAAYTSSNLEIGQWYHLAFTYKAGTVSIYKDGVLDKTYNTGYVPNFAGITHISIGRGTDKTSYQTNCSLNDFRIYDHCLSEMEVKQLSQGLVLHYPLNRQGFGQENLFSQKYWTYSTSGWTGNVISSVAGSTIKPIINSDGSCILTGAGSSGNSQCYLYNSNHRVNLTANKTYTISVLVTSTNISKFRFWWYDYDSSGKRLATSATNTFTINNGETKLLSYTRTLSENTASCYWELNMYTADTSATLLLHAHSLKLEEGSIVTPWCPNSSDELATTIGLNGTIEYDTSGYCNNGMRTGTFTWTSDTPKYSVSSVHTGSNYIYLDSPPTETQTIAVWAKWNTIPSGQSVILVDNGSGIGLGLMSTGILCSTSKAGNSYTFSKANLVANTWYHFVIVKTGTTTRKLYINGVEQTTTSHTSNWTYSVDQLQLGKRSTTSDGFVGKLCDFRAYATALSADDVLSLYQNCATIDPDGTIRGQIR